MIGVVLDSFDMQANGVHVTDSDIFGAPKRKIESVQLAETDGSVIVKTSYEARTPTFTGYLQADTPAELRTLIDTFNRNMNKQNVNLDITEEDGSVRRYVVTTQNIMVSRPFGLNVANFDVEFYIASGVGTDTEETSLGSTAISNSTAELAIDIAGSYKGEPLITVTLTSITGGTGASVTVQNSDTLRGLTITRDWTSGDIIEVNCKTLDVYVNNVEVEYTGQVPSWQPGVGVISYVDSFSARSGTIVATYTPRYL